MLWPQAGPENTEATLKRALEAALQRGIGHLVVASNTGETAQALRDLAPEKVKVVCVSHHVGFKEPGHDEMAAEARQRLQGQGVPVLTTTHVLAGVDRALRFGFQGIYPAEIMAGTLRMLGQGVKVGVEISVMALDAGLIPYGEEVIAIGGTSRGADAAIVVRPAHANAILDTRIVEIICRPRL
ncbi:MAG: pyruvate kinase alpha/beta domain-containing protein [Limnochordia bacterium]|jgi:hypothetical protein